LSKEKSMARLIARNKVALFYFSIAVALLVSISLFYTKVDADQLPVKVAALSVTSADNESAIDALPYEARSTQLTREEKDYINRDSHFQVKRHYRFDLELPQESDPVTAQIAQEQGWILTLPFSLRLKLDFVHVTQAKLEQADYPYHYLTPGRYRLSGMFDVFKKTNKGWINIDSHQLSWVPRLDKEGNEWVLHTNFDAELDAKYIYNPQGYLSRVETPVYSYRLVYNRQKKVIAVHRSDDLSLGFAYGANGLIHQLINPKGDVTGYEYDSRDRLIRVVKSYETSENKSDNPVIQYHYEDENHPALLTGVTAPNGHVCLKCRYDESSGKLVYKDLFKPAKAPSEATSEIVWSNGTKELRDYETDELRQVTTAEGDQLIYQEEAQAYLDAMKPDITVRQHIDNFTSHCGNCGGIGLLKQEVYVYDEEGRIQYSVTTDLNDVITRYDFNNNERWVRKTEAAGMAEERVTERAFADSRHPNKVSTLKQEGLVTHYDYDDKGNLLSERRVDNEGSKRITRYEYDEKGN